MKDMQWDIAVKIPHQALRATFTRREKANLQPTPSPTGRGSGEAPGEGSSV